MDRRSAPVLYSRRARTAAPSASRSAIGGPLDRSSFVPLYYQLQEVLKEQIESGTWTTGEALPSEPELARRFGVSRVVVRQALAILEDDRQIVRIKGRGTFVAEPKLDARAGGLSRSLVVPRPAEVAIQALDVRTAHVEESIRGELDAGADEASCGSRPPVARASRSASATRSSAAPRPVARGGGQAGPQRPGGPRPRRPRHRAGAGTDRRRDEPVRPVRGRPLRHPPSRLRLPRRLYRVPPRRRRRHARSRSRGSSTAAISSGSGWRCPRRAGRDGGDVGADGPGRRRGRGRRRPRAPEPRRKGGRATPRCDEPAS